MTSIVFDTLEHAKKLRMAGFADIQAETLAFAIAELVKLLNEKMAAMATKQDLEKLEKATQRDLKIVADQLTNSLTIRLGSMLIAAVGVWGSLMKFFL
jgi:hypothetical protein